MMFSRFIGKYFLILLLIVLTIGCSSNRGFQQAEVDFEDGIYLIERSGDKLKKLYPLKSNERLIRFNQEFIEKTEQHVKYLVINKDENAPLRLSQTPSTQDQKDSRKLLLLDLTDEAKLQLKDFSAKHLMKQTSIVVNGEALTMHKVRSVIDGGQLQITRCTDNACELLYVYLKDNVEQKQP